MAKSVQEPGNPKFPSYIENEAVLWEKIKTTQSNKSAEFHEIQIDFELSETNICI